MAILCIAIQDWQRKTRLFKPTPKAPLLPALQIALHAPISTLHLYQKERCEIRGSRETIKTESRLFS